jgi:adenosine/AMP kinase
MEFKLIKIEKPVDMNFILGQSHFIKTVEDIHEAIININPGIKFGLAFCESSGKALIRSSGNDQELIRLAQKNALSLSCGHIFILFLGNAFPVNVLNTIKMVPEVVSVYCATANDTEVIVAETESGRGILGIIDGLRSKGIENEADVKERRDLLRKIGYKF